MVITTLCSTPFGIRDSTQMRVQDTTLGSKVLNAFRHQRFNTTHHTRCFDPRVGAQRLSASEIQHTSSGATCHVLLVSAQRLSASEIQHGLKTVSFIALLVSAQRLSASEIQHTASRRRWSGNDYPVLNAFRHQRFNTKT